MTTTDCQIFHKKPRPSDKLGRGFYFLTNLFYDFFSGLDGRELFVQVAPACRDKKNPRVAFACRGLFILRYKLILRLFQRAGWPRVVCTSRARLQG